MDAKENKASEQASRKQNKNQEFLFATSDVCFAIFFWPFLDIFTACVSDTNRLPEKCEMKPTFAVGFLFYQNF